MSKKKNKKTKYVHTFSQWYKGEMEGLFYSNIHNRELTEKEKMDVMLKKQIKEYGYTIEDFNEDPNFEGESGYLSDPHRGDYTLAQYEGYALV